MSKKLDEKTSQELREIGIGIGILFARFPIQAAYRVDQFSNALLLAAIGHAIYLTMIALCTNRLPIVMRICYSPQVLLSGLIIFLYIDPSAIVGLKQEHLHIAMLVTVGWGVGSVLVFRNQLRLIHFFIACAPLLMMNLEDPIAR